MNKADLIVHENSRYIDSRGNNMRVLTDMGANVEVLNEDTGLVTVEQGNYVYMKLYKCQKERTTIKKVIVKKVLKNNPTLF